MNYECKNITCMGFNNELSNCCDIHNHAEGEDCKGRLLHDDFIELLKDCKALFENGVFPVKNSSIQKDIFTGIFEVYGSNLTAIATAIKKINETRLD